MSGRATLLARLAGWCAALDWRAVPAEQRALVPLRVLDTAGLVAAGAQTEAVRAVEGMALAQGGAGAASLLTRAGRLPAAWAALVHGTAAHCRDYDDTFPDSVVHPGSAVIPAALAAGEAAGAAPADMAAAIVAGYEVAARIGGAAGRRFHARGLHASGVVGPLAAAVAAARAMRLSDEHTAWALGLAASMSGGLMAFQADGAWSKWLHLGWAAHGGVVAAELAARGFRGPLHALDGPDDLFAALLAGEIVERAAVANALGAEWRGGTAAFKYYPCAHVIQPYIDALLVLRRAHALAPRDVARVRCPIAAWAIPIVCEPRAAKLAPADELGAIASLPYLLAYALAEGEVTLAALGQAARARSDLRALADRVVPVEDARMGSGFDARVEVETRGGAHHAAEAGAAGVDAQRLVAKFVANAAPLLGAVRAEQAAAALAAMEAPDPAAISRLFARA